MSTVLDTPFGALAVGEPHPAAILAMDYLASRTPDELRGWANAFASSAAAGHRMSEVCGETLRRVQDAKPVSDRYVLGLVMVMRGAERRRPLFRIRRRRWPVW